MLYVGYAIQYLIIEYGHAYVNFKIHLKMQLSYDGNSLYQGDNIMLSCSIFRTISVPVSATPITPVPLKN